MKRRMRGESLHSVDEQAQLKRIPLSQTLAGKLSRNVMHAEGKGELAAVVQIMLHHVPDNPGARQLYALTIPVIGKSLPHIVGAPTGQAVCMHCPVRSRARPISAVVRAGRPGSSQLAYAFTSAPQSSPRKWANQPARQPMMCRAFSPTERRWGAARNSSCSAVSSASDPLM